MTSLISYPRTSAPAPGSAMPLAAYANVPEPLRSKLIRKGQARHERFSHAHPGLAFLAPSYVDPGKFGNYFRDDNVGRDFPELGATPGALPATTSHLAMSAAGPQQHYASQFARELAIFVGAIDPSTHLADDTILWRFVGAAYTGGSNAAPAEAFFCNALGGTFWGVGPVPQSEQAWRRLYAIPGIWNGDGGYIALRLGDLPADIRHIMRSGLIGTVAPQPSQAPGYYLAGGGTQLVVSADIFDHKAYFEDARIAPVQRSQWNQ